MSDVAVRTLVNNGIYAPREAARLLRVHPELVFRWTRSGHETVRGIRHSKAALVPPTYGDLLSFLDLISLMAVAELWDRGVSSDDIRIGTEMLRRELDTPYPLAHRAGQSLVATSGTHFLARVSDGVYVDAGHGGQGIFQEAIVGTVRPLEYGSDQLAVLWRPHEHVWVNPRIQAGTPCVDGRRVPTRLLFQLVDNGDDPAEVANAYELEESDVTAAVEWERSLAA